MGWDCIGQAWWQGHGIDTYRPQGPCAIPSLRVSGPASIRRFFKIRVTRGMSNSPGTGYDSLLFVQPCSGRPRRLKRLAWSLSPASTRTHTHTHTRVACSSGGSRILHSEELCDTDDERVPPTTKGSPTRTTRTSLVARAGCAPVACICVRRAVVGGVAGNVGSSHVWLQRRRMKGSNCPCHPLIPIVIATVLGELLAALKRLLCLLV
jgi:hypothetical protein